MHTLTFYLRAQFAVIQNIEILDATEVLQTLSAHYGNEEITNKNLTNNESLEVNGELQSVDDISELRNEPVFDEMFSLLRSFLSPYSSSQDKKHDTVKRNTDISKNEINDTVGIAKYFSSLKQQNGNIKTVNCTHINSTNKHPDSVQIWFMMHLPKKHKDLLQTKSNYNIDSWIEKFFEQFLRSFESSYDEISEHELEEDVVHVDEEHTAATHLIGTHKIVIDTENLTETIEPHNLDSNESNEITADFHVMPETDSTFRTTQKFFNKAILPKDKKAQLDNRPVNIWNIKDNSDKKHKRSAQLKNDKMKRSVLEENDTAGNVAAKSEAEFLPFVRRYENYENNQLRSKRIKRDVPDVSVPISVDYENDFPSTMNNIVDNIVPAVNNTHGVRQRRDDVNNSNANQSIELTQTDDDDDDNEIQFHEDRKPLMKETGKFKQTKNINTRKMRSVASKRGALWLTVTFPTVLCKLFMH